MNFPLEVSVLVFCTTVTLMSDPRSESVPALSPASAAGGWAVVGSEPAAFFLSMTVMLWTIRWSF